MLVVLARTRGGEPYTRGPPLPCLKLAAVCVKALFVVSVSPVSLPAPATIIIISSSNIIITNSSSIIVS